MPDLKRAVVSVPILALLATSLGAQTPRFEGTAHAGDPLGAARVRFEVPDPAALRPGEERFNMAGDHRRIFHPVFLPDPVAAGPAGPAGSPAGFTVLFLFTGSDPLHLIVTTNLSRNAYREYHARLEPSSDRDGSARGEALQAWWRGCAQLLRASAADEGHYPVVENYLAWYLPRRLGLPGGRLSLPSPGRPLSAFPEVEGLVDLLVGTESLRVALQRDTLLVEGKGGGSAGAAQRPSLPLPTPPAIPPVELPPLETEPALEEMARLAPQDCLYVRFPRLRDLQSLRRRAEGWGGNLHDLVAGRSLDASARDTVLGQLALRETVLGRLLGDLAIGETAFLARDTFVREGSALGVLFEVKNEPLFAAALREMRNEAREASRERAVEEEVTLRGRAVRFLHSPGNRLRSFHTSAGRFHLVSNCRKLVEDFLACAEGKGSSLAADPGFRHARALHPLSAPQNALVFVSDAFLRELVGPAYRAEMTRRARVRAAMEIAEVARTLARAETGRDLSIPALVEAGYLPAEAVRGPDSELVDSPLGLVDSRRGARGTFLPIPDAEVSLLTPTEARAYAEFSSFYRRQWGRIDPAAIRLWMEPAGTEAAGGQPLERLRMVVDILPFAREPYRMLQTALGPPGMRSMPPLPEELLSLEGEVGGLVSFRPFWARVGVLDFDRPVLSDESGVGFLLADPSRLPAYVVLPVTERLPSGGLKALILTTTPAADGFHAVDGGFRGLPLWGRPAGERLVLSTRKETAERAAAGLRFTEAPPAQARLGIEPLAGRRISGALRGEAYRRARAASLSTAGFLSLLHGGLKVPLEDCPAAARRILGAAPACALGGRFTHSAYPVGGGPFFSSDAPPVGARGEAFEHPLLDALRGLRVSLTLSGRSLHSELEAVLGADS